MANRQIRVLLVGQPNVGKSTLFNVLSRARTRVSNWPGTTVEIKRAQIMHRSYLIELVDLPGTYSLTPTSTEERVARMAIMSERADVLLVLVDSTTLERSLLLAIEVLEMCSRTIIALTKYDLLHKHGLHINISGLEKKLRVPVVPISAYTGEGIQQLLDTIIEVSTHKTWSEGLRIDYGNVEKFINKIEHILNEAGIHIGNVCNRWVAIKMLEGDNEIIEIVKELSSREIFEKILNVLSEAEREIGKNIDLLIVDARRRFVKQLIQECLVEVKIRHSPIIEKFDRIFMHPVYGTLLSMLLLTFTIFAAFMINVGFPLNIILELAGYGNIASMLEEYSLSGLLDKAFGYVADVVYAKLSSYSIPLAELVAHGIIDSVGAVLSFLPLILVVSILLAIIEDSGLGARMAVALHGLFSRLGLSGRAVYPTVVALGCNVPAVLATRIAISAEERVPLALAVTFIPCQARFVVLMFIAAALAPADPVSKTIVVLVTLIVASSLYSVTAKAFSKLTKVESTELVLEIPPLHSPNLRVVWWISWDIVKHFLVRAGTTILVSSIILWLLLHFGPSGYVSDITKSCASIMGHLVAPFVTYLFDIPKDVAWRLGLALMYGLVAKENIVATLASTGATLQKLSLGQALAIAILTTTYVPCLPTMLVLWKELRNGKLVLMHVLYMCALATISAAVVYRIVSMLLIAVR